MMSNIAIFQGRCFSSAASTFACAASRFQRPKRRSYSNSFASMLGCKKIKLRKFKTERPLPRSSNPIRRMKCSYSVRCMCTPLPKNI